MRSNKMGNKKSKDALIDSNDHDHPIQLEHEYATLSLREVYYNHPWDLVWQEAPTKTNYMYAPAMMTVKTVKTRDAMEVSHTKLHDHVTLYGLTKDCVVILTPAQEQRIQELAKKTGHDLNHPK
jgi:hypothetical protein